MYEDNELTPEFWRRRRWLRWLWDNHQNVWTELDFNDQRVLHDYYAPAKNLEGHKLIAWLRSDRLTWARNATHADQVFRYLRDLYLIPPPPPTPSPTALRLPIRKAKFGVHGGPRHVAVTAALATPEVDYDGYVRVLVSLVRQLQEEEAKGVRPSD
jgi:hypothetical protein